MENIDMHKDKQIYLLVCGNVSWCFGTLTVTDLLATGTEGKSVQPVGELCIKHSVSVIFARLPLFLLKIVI
jgi:hypothetical protein